MSMFRDAHENTSHGQDEPDPFELAKQRLEEWRDSQAQTIGDLRMGEIEQMAFIAHLVKHGQVFNEGLPGPGNGVHRVDGYKPDITLGDPSLHILKRPDDK